MFLFAATFLAGRSSVASGGPVNITPPTISGGAFVGATLTAQSGVWDGDPVAFTWQWVSNGSEIPGARSITWVVAAQYLGTVITVRATATDASGRTGSAISGGTAAVQEGKPVLISAPVVTGDPKVGSTLSAAGDQWEYYSATSFAGQWYRGSTAIPNATGAAYKVVSADIGYNITYVRTATSAGGSTPATSNAVGPAYMPAPVNISQPVISGGRSDRTAAVGARLSGSTGSWENAPTRYEYRWYYSGGGVVSTSSQYTAKAADVGELIYLSVTAINSGGQRASMAIYGIRIEWD